MYNVLISDSHPIVCYGLEHLVNQQVGFQVIGRENNGFDTYLKIEQGKTDILITSLNMPPGENMLLTIRRIHVHFPRIRIMVFSAHEEQKWVNCALHNGAMSYILKNSPTREIVAGLTHLANDELYLDNNIMITGHDRQNIQSKQLEQPLTTFETLSRREQELFPFIALGYSDKEIAKKLFISPKTVQKHKASIKHKLHLVNQAALIHYAIHHHLIDI